MMSMLRSSGFLISNHNFLAQLMNSARLSDKLPRSTTSNQVITLQNMRNLNNSWLNANMWLAPNTILKWYAELLKICAIKLLLNQESTHLDINSNFTKENFKELVMLTRRTLPMSTLSAPPHKLDSLKLVILLLVSLTWPKLTNTLHAISEEDLCKSNLKIFQNKDLSSNSSKSTPKSWKISKSKLREIELFTKLVKVRHLISIFQMIKNFGKHNLWFVQLKDNSSLEIWVSFITLELSSTPNVKFKFKKDLSLILEKLFIITLTKLFITKSQVSKEATNSISWDQIKITRLMLKMFHILELDQFGSVLMKTSRIFKTKSILTAMVKLRTSTLLEDQWKETFKLSLRQSQLTTARSNTNQEKVGPSASEAKKSAPPTVLIFS